MLRWGFLGQVGEVSLQRCGTQCQERRLPFSPATTGRFQQLNQRGALRGFTWQQWGDTLRQGKENNRQRKGLGVSPWRSESVRSNVTCF